MCVFIWNLNYNYTLIVYKPAFGGSFWRSIEKLYLREWRFHPSMVSRGIQILGVGVTTMSGNWSLYSDPRKAFYASHSQSPDVPWELAALSLLMQATIVAFQAQLSEYSQSSMTNALSFCSAFCASSLRGSCGSLTAVRRKNWPHLKRYSH